MARAKKTEETVEEVVVEKKVSTKASNGGLNKEGLVPNAPIEPNDYLTLVAKQRLANKKK